MQLGISSYTYPWALGVPEHPPPQPMTASGLLEQAARLGVSVVQIADNLPLDRLSPSQLDALETQASDNRISIEVGTRGIALDHLRTYLRLAQRLGSPIVRVVIDTADHHPDPDTVVHTLRDIIHEFESKGVRLAIENHDRFTAQTLAGVVRQIGSANVGICLDTVNSFGALEGPRAVLRALGPLVMNLHVKDFAIFRASHMMGFTVEGRPAGQGMLNVPWLLGELGRLGVDANAVLELWTPPEEDLAATIRKEDAWAVESVTYLRTLIAD